MILTTADMVQGQSIGSYLGIVSGQNGYTIGGALGKALSTAFNLSISRDYKVWPISLHYLAY